MPEPLPLQVTVTDARCLIGWPDGTPGAGAEEAILGVLIDLCNRYGYGRVPQLARGIEDLWRNPASREGYERARAEQTARLNEYWRTRAESLEEES